MTCFGIICAGTIICSGASASQGGLDLAFALPLRDAQYCRSHLRLFDQY